MNRSKVTRDVKYSKSWLKPNEVTLTYEDIKVSGRTRGSIDALTERLLNELEVKVGRNNIQY